jgi:hypothetical protein
MNNNQFNLYLSAEALNIKYERCGVSSAKQDLLAYPLIIFCRIFVKLHPVKIQDDLKTMELNCLPVEK